ALSYELLYNRILIYFLGNTTFSFTLIVTFFILGYSLGSYLFVKLMKNRKKLSLFINLFILLQMGIAVYHLFLPLLLPGFHHLMIEIKTTLINGGWASFWAEFVIRFISSSAILSLPALCFGITFPLVYRIYFGTITERLDEKTTGKIFGKINAINTLGSVLGPFVTGFLLIALFQVSLTLRFISIINILIGFVLLFVVLNSRRENKKVNIIKPSLLILTWTLLIFILPVHNQLGKKAARQSPADVILYYREGVFGTVSVSINKENIKMLKINGVGEVPTDHDSMRAFRMLAYLPFMIHDNPQSLLSIAFGGGITFGSIANTKLPDLKCVEICKDVLAAAPYYRKENNRVYENKKVQIIIGDGRHYSQNTREQFDIITSDATHPASFDSWVLYTREFYTYCKKKLKSGGVMAQWVPLHGLSITDYKTILKTFSGVFKHTNLYLANAYTIIIGSQDKIALKNGHFKRWAIGNKKIQQELCRININSLADIQNCLLLTDQYLHKFVKNSPVSTDAFSPLQFAELRSLESNRTVIDNLSALLNFRAKERLWNFGLDPYMRARILAEEGAISRTLDYINVIDPKVNNNELQFLKLKILKEMAIRDTPSLLRENDRTLVVKRLKTYIDLFPREGYFYSLLGHMYFIQKKTGPATDLIVKSIRLSPWNPAVQKIALNFFITRNRFKDALPVVKRLRKIEPMNKTYSDLQNKINDGVK
ncbi:MAG: hypothetical protein KAT17_10245, partial [Candidatus Aminicenantes bacterium]|nr:hypothetical protein [Candidatus Aminicenantes bacterium]